MAENVLINVKIEGTENEAKIDSLTQSILELQEANKKLANENKTLAKAEGDNTKAIVENAKQIELNKQKITENSASRKGLIQTIVSEDNSIKALSVRNAELIKQRNLINTSTEEGRRKISSINSQIDANNKTIRENSSALEKQKINIGNYASALDGIVPGLGGFVSGIQAATKAGLAFIATPLGAVIGAVALALGALINFFKTTGEGEDALAKGTAVLTGLFNLLKQGINFVVESILDFTQSAAGQFIGKVIAIAGAISPLGLAMQALAKIFPETTARIQEQARAAAALADELDAASDAAGLLSLKEKEVRNEIDLLILQSKSKGLTEAQRSELLQKALQKEIDLNKELAAQKQRDLKNSIEGIKLENKAALDAINTVGLNNEQIAKKLLEGSKITDDQRANLLKFLGDIEDARGRSLEIQAKIQNKQIASDEKAAAAAEKAYEKMIEALQKLSDKRFKLEQFEVEQQEKLREEYIKTQEELAKLIATKEDYNNAIDLSASLTEQETADKKEQAQADKEVLEAAKKEVAIQAVKRKSLDLLSESLVAAGQHSKELAIAGVLASRFQAVSEIISNTGIANAKAVAASPLTAGLPWVAINTIAAGIAIGSTIANAITSVGEITKAAGGGNFLTKGPTLLMVGDNPGGVERVTVEPLSGRGKTVVGSGMIKMAGGGTLTTGGITGNEVRTASALAQNAFSANQMAALINQVKTVLVLQDFEAVQTSRDTTVNKAQVLG